MSPERRVLVSAPAAPLALRARPRGGRSAAVGREARARPWRLLVASCLGLAVLSLLGPSVPTYDPWAWIIWGREITEGTLTTTEGPSWKPLPVLFTTPFALFGDDAAPLLWLVIARAGGLLALAMAYRLGARLSGPVAGIIAAGALLLAAEFVRNFARGNSEGLLVALVLWAIERHLDGRRLDAFLLGFGAALLRPEVWPFWGLYGLWLAWREPRWRVAVGASAVACLALWFLPEWIGSGDPLRAAARARQPNPDSAAFAASPFLEVFRRAGSVLSLPVLVGAVVALVAAAGASLKRASGETRFSARLRLALGLTATVLMIGVALMTEAGFAGNLRYVALPAALVCVLAGVGWVELVRGARTRFGAAAAVGLAVLLAGVSVPLVAQGARTVDRDLGLIHSEADFYGSLKGVVARAGGSEAVRACGGIFTGDFQVQALAYYLHVHGMQVTIPPEVAPPGTVFGPRYSALSRDERFPLLFETRKWIVRRACAP
jgi:hypothetical protein